MSNIVTLVRNAYFAGDYPKCCELARKDPHNAEVRSLAFRGLLELGRYDEAKTLTQGRDGALDQSLLLYASTHPSRDGSSFNWSEALASADSIMALEGDRDESAVILALVYSWAEDYEKAYHLAAQSSALEA